MSTVRRRESSQLDAPKQEIALLANAVNLLVQAASSDDGATFHGPSIDEFFPPAIFSIGGFEVNRIMLVRFIAVVALLLVFWLGTRRMKVVPGRFQSLVEMGLDLVRVNIAEDLLGRKDGRRFAESLRAPVRAPVLQLHGDFDTCVLPSTAQGSGQFVSGRYEWQLLDGVGHYPHNEVPERISGELLRWAKDG